MWSLPSQAFLQTDEALITYHKVINQFNIQMLSRGDQLLRDGDVFGRRSGIAAWMIMANDNGRTIAYDSWTVDFSGAEHGTVDRSLVTTDVFYDAILGIENQDTHLV